MHQGKEPNKKETMRRGHKPASCGRAPWSQAFWNSQVQKGSPDLGNLVLDDRCQHGRAYFQIIIVKTMVLVSKNYENQLTIKKTKTNQPASQIAKW